MIIGIILAAGEGNRIGKEKLKLQLGGKSVLEWVLEAAVKSMIDEIILVIKPDDNGILEIGKKWKSTIIINPDYKNGMSTTVKKGLIELENKERIDGFFLILGDQPFINKDIINHLIKFFNKGKKDIVVPYYQGKRGNPVLFDIQWKEELMKVTGDVGGRVLIKKYPHRIKRVNFANDAILFDIDTNLDYMEACKNIHYFQNGRN